MSGLQKRKPGRCDASSVECRLNWAWQVTLKIRPGKFHFENSTCESTPRENFSSTPPPPHVSHQPLLHVLPTPHNHRLLPQAIAELGNPSTRRGSATFGGGDKAQRSTSLHNPCLHNYLSRPSLPTLAAHRTAIILLHHDSLVKAYHLLFRQLSEATILGIFGPSNI